MKALNILLEITIYSGVLLCAIMLIKLRFKNRMSPFLHFVIWGLLIARLLIPVTLESAVHLFVVPAETSKAVVQQQTPVTNTDTILGNNAVGTNQAKTQANVGRQTQNATTPSMVAANTTTGPQVLALSTDQILLAVWLTGTGIGLIYLAALYGLLRRRIRKNAQAPSKRLLDLFAEVKAELNIRRDVRIIGQCEYGTPAVLFPGTVLMPMGTLVSMSDDEVKFVLRHELMHFKRHDHILGLVLSVLNAVYWFNPVVWIAFKQIRVDMEIACDSRVVRTFSSDEKSTYAAVILSLFSKKQYGNLVLGMVQGNTRKIAEKRIKGVFMHHKSNGKVKITAVLLTSLLLFTCFTTACQPTPENPAVIQKDNFENLIGNTAQPTAQQTPIDRITWEDEFINKHKEGTSTRITVNVDAAINAQQNSGSVFSVEPGEYDLEFAKKAADYFMGDEYYDDEYTKDDFLKMILPLQKAIPTIEDIRGSKGDVENRLQFYQRQYEFAPNDNEPGKIAFEKARFDYIGLKGYPYDGAVSELYIGNGGMRYTNFYYVVQNGLRVYKASNHVYAGTPARQMKTSYVDAKIIADEAIYNIYGENMSLVQTDLYNVYPIDGTYGSALRGLLDDSCEQCYMFTFTPLYGGLPQLYAPEATNLDDLTSEGIPMYEQNWDYEYSMKWPAQYVQVLVDDSGIVQFWGFSPTKVTHTVNENVAMLSFDEIFERFKKNIFYSSVWSYSGLDKVNIHIDQIVFGMIRVPVKDNPDTYYMIPAWQFIGSKEEIHVPFPDDFPEELKESTDISPYTESGKTFLVLNALDSSIIDTSYFVSVRGELEKTIGVSKE